MVQAITTGKGTDAVVKHSTYSFRAICKQDGCEWAYIGNESMNRKRRQQIKDRCFEHMYNFHAIPLSECVVVFERISEKVAR
jgi:hypothetical protein